MLPRNGRIPGAPWSYICFAPHWPVFSLAVLGIGMCWLGACFFYVETSWSTAWQKRRTFTFSQTTLKPIRVRALHFRRTELWIIIYFNKKMRVSAWMEEAPFAIPFLCPLTILKCHQAELTNDSSMSSSFMYCLSLLHFHFHHSIAAKTWRGIVTSRTMEKDLIRVLIQSSGLQSSVWICKRDLGVNYELGAVLTLHIKKML